MQSNRTCQLVEQYLSYLAVIKGRSENTIKEYRTDLLMFFEYVMNSRSIPLIKKDFSSIDISFIKTINLNDITFISYCKSIFTHQPAQGQENRFTTPVLEIPKQSIC